MSTPSQDAGASSTTTDWLSLAEAAATRFPITPARIEPVAIGLINRTFRISAPNGTRYVLQCLNPIHAPAVNLDIAAVTAHLARHGVLTPLLIPADTGATWLELDGRIWRMLSYIDGDTRPALHHPTEAQSAGAVLAGFHLALFDYPDPLRNARLGIHDFDRHMAFLRRTLTTGREHPRFERVVTLAERILDYSRTLPPLPVLPDRVVHGDPKITNFIYRHGTDQALCLVDLDTLARMPLALELGDALRSWCNPRGEDEAAGDFSLTMLRAAAEGYAAIARGHIDEIEWRAFIPATLRIQVELAARFCADALNESYFGWNPTRFESRGEHNEVRALGQFTAAQSLAAQREEASTIVAAAFS